MYSSVFRCIPVYFGVFRCLVGPLTLAILYIMHKEGTELPMWKIVKELNSNLRARLNTKYGQTRKINITDSIRQGGVISVIQYALMMDEINKEIIKKKAGPKLHSTEEYI